MTLFISHNVCIYVSDQDIIILFVIAAHVCSGNSDYYKTLDAF